MTFLIFCRYVQCTFHEAVIKSYELSCRCSLHSLHHHFCAQNLSNTRPPSLDIYLSAMPSTAKQNCPERTTLPPLADPDEIRLLCLLPGGFGERIICTTIHVKLSENFQAEPPAPYHCVIAWSTCTAPKQLATALNMKPCLMCEVQQR
jgi:hypothetical protein